MWTRLLNTKELTRTGFTNDLKKQMVPLLEDLYIPSEYNNSMRPRSFRKALSPLIATILLIAFTIGVGSFIADWFTKYARGNIERASTSGQQAVECSRQNIDILSVEHPSETEVRVRLWNSGQYPVILKRVVAFNYTDMYPCIVFENKTGMVLEKGREVYFINTSCPEGYGGVFSVRATTTCPSVFDEWINRS